MRTLQLLFKAATIKILFSCFRENILTQYEEPPIGGFRKELTMSKQYFYKMSG